MIDFQRAPGQVLGIYSGPEGIIGRSRSRVAQAIISATRKIFNLRAVIITQAAWTVNVIKYTLRYFISRI